MQARYFLPVKTVAVFIIITAAIGIITTGFKDKKEGAGDDQKFEKVARDSVESVKAFAGVYKVLMSPRCMNCHPAGEIPLQGDDSHIHTMFPKRGKDGKGLYAMKCASCHQPANVPGVHTPPGNPNWALPPSDMKMVFQGKTARQLALQIMDYNRNGHRDKAKLLEHANDTLVKAGWQMGEGRTPPPLSYDEFVTAWNKWIEKGGYAPKN